MLTAAVLSPFVAAAFVPVLYPVLRHRIGYGVLLVPLSLFLYFAARVPGVARGETPAETLAWVPQLGLDLSFHLEGFSLLFALLITGIGTLVVIYALGYLGPNEDLGKFHLYILLFMGAMLGVATSANLIALYVFWEVTSLSSFLLIGFKYQKTESSYGALKAMTITVAGGLAMLAGIVMLGLVAGSFELGEIVARRADVLAHPLANWILVLLLLGPFTKSAQAPFHIWLPDAMAAPTPVSAYLHSATMVKAGLILVAKLWAVLSAHPLWFPLVGGFGLLTVLIGGMLALTRTDLKGILALSTVSQLGLVMSAFGVGSAEAAVAGVLHILTHAGFKGGLFMCAGIIDHETGTRDIRYLSGLRKQMPITATLMIITALAMMGLPPLSGFLSKEMWLEAMLHVPGGDAVRWLAAITAVLGSIFTATYSLILAHRIWFGPLGTDTPKAPHEAPALMWAPPAVLTAFTVLVGLFPVAVEKSLVLPAAAAVTVTPPEVHLSLWHGFNLPLLMSAIAIVGGVLCYTRLDRLVALVRALAPPLHSNRVYDSYTKGLEIWPRALTDSYMTGRLRDYLIYILSALVLLVGFTLYRSEVALWPDSLGPVEPYEAVVFAIMLIGSVVAVLTRTRMQAILALALMGMALALQFVLLRAPDLALTQLMVESILAVLFLLCFAHLPQLTQSRNPRSWQALNVVVAAGAGVIAGLLTLAAVSTRYSPSIAAYFVDQAKPLGGGTNVVNVILVDFRALDTLGEITVIGIAALAVYALVRLRAPRAGDTGPQPSPHAAGDTEGGRAE